MGKKSNVRENRIFFRSRLSKKTPRQIESRLSTGKMKKKKNERSQAKRKRWCAKCRENYYFASGGGEGELFFCFLHSRLSTSRKRGDMQIDNRQIFFFVFFFVGSESPSIAAFFTILRSFSASFLLLVVSKCCYYIKSE
jgi:hypothetical protein